MGGGLGITLLLMAVTLLACDWLLRSRDLNTGLSLARGVEVTRPGGVGLSLLLRLMSMSELLARLARCSSVSLSVSPQLSWSLMLSLDPVLDCWDSTLPAL